MKRPTLQITTTRLIVSAALTLFACTMTASAQTGTSAARPRATAQAPQQSEQAARPPNATTADEDFDLNIGERRITRSDFHAETAVETGGAGALDLKVGVAVRAGEIDVLLRNVQGHVRFRATLEPVLRLLDAHRASPQTTRPPPDNSP